MLPLDVDPVPHGNVVPVQRGDRMVAVVHGPDDGRPDGDAWTLHTSTCPLIIGDARPMTLWGPDTASGAGQPAPEG